MTINVSCCCKTPPPPGPCIVASDDFHRADTSTVGTGSAFSWTQTGTTVILADELKITGGGSVTANSSIKGDRFRVDVSGTHAGDTVSISLGGVTGTLTFGDTATPHSGQLTVTGGIATVACDIYASGSGSSIYTLYLCVGPDAGGAEGAVKFWCDAPFFGVSGIFGSAPASPYGVPKIATTGSGTVYCLFAQAILGNSADNPECPSCPTKICPICNDSPPVDSGGTCNITVGAGSWSGSPNANFTADSFAWLVSSGNPEGLPYMIVSSQIQPLDEGDRVRLAVDWNGVGDNLFVESEGNDGFSTTGCVRLYRNEGGSLTLLGAYQTDVPGSDAPLVDQALYLTPNLFSDGKVTSHVEQPSSGKVAIGTGQLTGTNGALMQSLIEDWYRMDTRLTCNALVEGCGIASGFDGPPAGHALACNVIVASGTIVWDPGHALGDYKVTTSGSRLTLQIMHPDNITEGTASGHWDTLFTHHYSGMLLGFPVTCSNPSGTKFALYVGTETVTLEYLDTGGLLPFWFLKISGFGGSGITPIESLPIGPLSNLADFGGLHVCVGEGIARMGLQPMQVNVHGANVAAQVSVAIGSHAVETPTPGSAPVFWGQGVETLLSGDSAWIQRGGFGFSHTRQTQPATAPYPCISCTTPTPWACGPAPLQLKVVIGVSSGSDPHLQCGSDPPYAGTYILDWTGLDNFYSIYIGPSEGDLAGYIAGYVAGTPAWGSPVPGATTCVPFDPYGGNQYCVHPMYLVVEWGGDSSAPAVSIVGAGALFAVPGFGAETRRTGDPCGAFSIVLDPCTILGGGLAWPVTIPDTTYTCTVSNA